MEGTSSDHAMIGWMVYPSMGKANQFAHLELLLVASKNSKRKPAFGAKNSSPNKSSRSKLWESLGCLKRSGCDQFLLLLFPRGVIETWEMVEICQDGINSQGFPWIIRGGEKLTSEARHKLYKEFPVSSC